MLRSIETRRLLIRPFRDSDVEAAHEWFGDGDVMKYTPSGPDASIEKTRERVRDYQRHQREHGFSKWLVTDRMSGEPLGDAGLLVLTDPAWTDLGFRFLKKHWGKGLATEAGSAWVTAAFDNFRLAELGGFAHPDNAASIVGLERLGFKPVRHGVVLGMRAAIFVCRR